MTKTIKLDEEYAKSMWEKMQQINDDATTLLNKLDQLQLAEPVQLTQSSKIVTPVYKFTMQRVLHLALIRRYRCADEHGYTSHR